MHFTKELYNNVYTITDLESRQYVVSQWGIQGSNLGYRPLPESAPCVTQSVHHKPDHKFAFPPSIIRYRIFHFDLKLEVEHVYCFRFKKRQTTEIYNDFHDVILQNLNVVP